MIDTLRKLIIVIVFFAIALGIPAYFDMWELLGVTVMVGAFVAYYLN